MDVTPFVSVESIPALEDQESAAIPSDSFEQSSIVDETLRILNSAANVSLEAEAESVAMAAVQSEKESLLARIAVAESSLVDFERKSLELGCKISSMKELGSIAKRETAQNRSKAARTASYIERCHTQTKNLEYKTKQEILQTSALRSEIESDRALISRLGGDSNGFKQKHLSLTADVESLQSQLLAQTFSRKTADDSLALLKLELVSLKASLSSSNKQYSTACQNVADLESEKGLLVKELTTGDAEHKRLSELIILQEVKLKESQHKINSLTQQITECQKKTSEIVDETNKVEEQISFAHQQTQSAKEDISRLSESCAQLDTETTGVQTRIKQQETISDKVILQTSSLNDKLRSLRNVHEDTLSEKVILGQRISQLSAALKAKQSKIIQLHLEVQKTGKYNDSIQESTTVSKERLSALTVISNQQESEKQIILRNLDELNAGIVKQNHALRVVVKERDLLIGQAAKKTAEMGDLIEQISIVEQELDGMNSLCMTFENDKQTLENKIKDCKKELTPLKEKLENIRSLKKDIHSLNKQTSDLQGKYAAMLTILDIPINLHRWRATNEESHLGLIKHIRSIQVNLIEQQRSLEHTNALINDTNSQLQQLTKTKETRQSILSLQEECESMKIELKEQETNFKELQSRLKKERNSFLDEQLESGRLRRELDSVISSVFKDNKSFSVQGRLLSEVLEVD